ncbi:hypothetical protein BH10ACT10_BH10ACT10_02080 [soil metagenome]
MDYRVLNDADGQVSWASVSLRGGGARSTEEPQESIADIVANIRPQIRTDIEEHGRPHAFFDAAPELW